MKIVLNDTQDIQDFIALCGPALLRAWNPALAREFAAREVQNVEAGGNMAYMHQQMEARMQAEPDGLPTDIPAPTVERVRTPEVLAAKMRSAPFHVDAATAAPTDELENDDLPGIDADGVPHDTCWHSEPAKINADGRWRARRKRNEVDYEIWVSATRMAAEAADAEPVATETHALPQDEQHSTDPEMDRALSADAKYLNAMGADAGPTLSDLEAPETPTVDLQALVAASFDQAASQSTDVRELLNAAQAFTTAHGHAKFNELKSAVAPIDGNPFGKALQLFTPEERQLMMACLANYPSN